MKRNLLLLFLICLLTPITALASGHAGVKLDSPMLDIADHASLQRGAKYYMNYCVGCHSLEYMRYEGMADGIGLLNKDGDIDNKTLSQNLIFTNAKPTDPILNAMLEDDITQWFGIAPPDLSLIARVRGVDWLYTYLRSFYQDQSKPSGSNNLIFPSVAMPNVLEPLQGIQIPIYQQDMVHVASNVEPVMDIVGLKLEAPGALTPTEYNQVVTDLVNFLSYVSEPSKLDRYRLGVWVLLFLFFFLIMVYLLKKEYWRDVN